VLGAATTFDIAPNGPMFDLTRDYVVLCFAPILACGPYRITHDYARSLYTGMVDNAAALAKAKKGELSALPAEWLFFNRLQLGFYSVLARLDVEVDYNALDAELLAGDVLR
jgi:hypothetical protein